MAEKTLKPEVASKYELVPGTPIHGGFVGFGPIDLSEISLATADNLFSAGFPGLQLKAKKSEKDTGK